MLSRYKPTLHPDIFTWLIVEQYGKIIGVLCQSKANTNTVEENVAKTMTKCLN